MNQKLCRNLYLSINYITALHLKLKIWSCITLVVSSIVLYAQPFQRFQSFSYGINDGMLQSSIHDLGFDANNQAWISYSNGLQKFDGLRFKSVPLQEGLPSNLNIQFFTTRQGELWMSHQHGISRYLLETDRFEWIYEKKETDGDHILLLAQIDTLIFGINQQGAWIALSEKDGREINRNRMLPNKTKKGISFFRNLFSNHQDGHMAVQYDGYLYVYNLMQGRVVDSVQTAKTHSFFKPWLVNKNEVLIGDADKSLVLKKVRFGSKQGFEIQNTISRDISKAKRGGYTYWNDTYCLYFDNRLLMMDDDMELPLAEVADFINQPPGGAAVIADLKTDNFGNLYLITLNDGLRKIMKYNFPVRYFGTIKKESNYFISLLADKQQNRIFAGSYGSGLFVFDTLQRIIKHIEKLPGQETGFTPSLILRQSDGSYLLFILLQKGFLWRLSPDLLTLKKVNVRYEENEEPRWVNYYSSLVHSSGDTQWVFSNPWLYKVFSKENYLQAHFLPIANFSSCFFVDGSLLFAKGDTLQRLEPQTLRYLGQWVLKGSGVIRCFATLANGALCFGSDNGIFFTDSSGKILQHLTKKDGLPDDGIYAMVSDDEGKLWCSTNRGIFALDANEVVFNLRKEDGLQENEFNTRAVARSADGELFFGGVNGISSFYPSQLKLSLIDTPNIMVSNVLVNNMPPDGDIPPWNLRKLVLPHDRNLLSLSFLAAGIFNPDQYNYWFRMVGLDEAWVKMEQITPIRYVLPPGRYTLQLYASRTVNQPGRPLHELLIVIKAPFWKTWWFVLLTILFGLAIVGLGVYAELKRRYRKQLAILQAEKEQREERERISRDLHDSLGAYVNAVLYNVELLESDSGQAQQQVVLKDLKFVSKDIINSLRETVWAFKKDEYTAEECFIRIRSFIHACSRYYAQIHFKVTGDVPNERVLSYRNALNLVRIIQEAVTNAIRHADCTQVTVNSFTEGEKWNLEVTDNGVGFDSTNINFGNGLQHMKQRSDESQLSFKIKSEKGMGTIIQIII